MTFARVWASGIGDGIKIPGAQFTQLDLNISRAVDGYAGGKVSPLAPIEVAGAGLRVSGPLNLSGALAPAAAMNWSTPALVAASTNLGDICSPHPGNIVVSGDGLDQIFQSLDDGLSWTDISANITSPQSLLLQALFSDYAEAASVASVQILMGGITSAVLYRSTNGGASFSNLTLPGTPTGIRVISRASDGLSSYLAGGNTAAAAYMAWSPTGASGTWTAAALPGAITGVVTCISIAHAPGGLVVAAFNGSQTKLAVSTDGGQTWVASTTALTAGAYTVAYCNGVFLAADTAGHFYSSADGMTWTTLGLATIVDPWTQMFSLNGMLVATSNKYVTYSVDNGASLHPVRKTHATRTRTGFSAKPLDGRLWYFTHDTSPAAYIEKTQRIGVRSLGI